VFELGEGTVYPSLHRLERDGLIQSRWVKHASRRRRSTSSRARVRLRSAIATVTGVCLREG
jgi:hypothetical protein